MGANCCTAIKDKDLPDRNVGGNLLRSARCSPTWSFRWENRRHVAGEIDDSSFQMSHGLSRDVSVELKGTLAADRGNLADCRSPHESCGTPISLKSPVHEGMDGYVTKQPSDLSMERTYHIEEMVESPDNAGITAPKISFFSHSSLSTPVADPVTAHSHQLLPNSTPSRHARCSPGHRSLRQISDSRILGLKSPNSCSTSEGRSSFVLSTSSNDLAVGSHLGCSDGWSMRTFSELVASSQRERWSFESEHLGSGFGKNSVSSSRFSYSPLLDLQTCRVCSKFLMERSSWAASELSVVAVLVCGHTYHANCLESMTLEVEKYDPSCPICTGGEKQFSKMPRKAFKGNADLRSKSHKISRNCVIDSSLDSDSDDSFCQINAITEASRTKPSFGATSSNAKPFLRRHFTFGSERRKSALNRDSSRKKGFWAR